MAEANNKGIDFQQYRNDWAMALMTKGIIVKLNINRWRGTARLSNEDLGIKFAGEKSRKFSQQYISLGREKLIPPDIDKRFLDIERDARSNLKQHSFSTIWGWFVPFTAFDVWEENNLKIRQTFFDAANEMGENYDSIIGTVREAYIHMAADVWTRLYPNGGDPSPSFVANFANKIIDKIPSRSTIVSSFRYDVTYLVIPMPSIIEKNISIAQQEQQKQQMESFKINLEKRTREKVAKAYIEKKQDLIDSFLQATVNDIREQVSNLCNKILESMRDASSPKDISRFQRDKLKKTIEKIRLLNFYDDNKMTNLLIDLEKEVDKFKGERNRNEMIATLEKIVQIGTEEFIPEDFNPSISSLEL